MADNLRNQINAARRGGYSDAEIVDYLKGSDARVAEALTQGYTPEQITAYLSPPPTLGEQALRKTGVTVRGATEALAPVTTGALAGAGLGLLTGVAAPVAVPAGALAGGLAVPLADASVALYNRLLDKNVPMPSQAVSALIPGPRAETPEERVLQTAGGAFAGTGGQIAAGRVLTQAAQTAPGVQAIAPGIEAVGKEVSRRPIGQLIAAPVSTAAGQTATELTDNPFIGLGVGLATGATMGLRGTKREAAPSSEKLLENARRNYNVLDASGFELKRQDFHNQIGRVYADLRKEGFDTQLHPKVAAALNRLGDINEPKNVTNLQTLRKIIKSSTESSSPSEIRLGNMLLDEFDDFVMKAPNSAVISGDKQAIDAWRSANENYSRFKKGEIFTDMIEKAQLSQGSTEAAMARQLSALAKNDKKMRFFTPDEQTAIKEAAKGGTVQQLLRTVAKFTPMTPAAAIFTAVSPYGAWTAGAGMTAGAASEARRIQMLNRLGAQMRLGRQPQITESAFANIPMFLTPELRNAMSQPSQNNLAP